MPEFISELRIERIQRKREQIAVRRKYHMGPGVAHHYRLHNGYAPGLSLHIRLSTIRRF